MFLLKYLALGLIPILWALPGTYLYMTVMVFGEAGIYLLPAFGALLLFCWHWIGRRAGQYDLPRKPVCAALLVHIPMLVLIAGEAAAVKGLGLPGDGMLWSILAAAVRMPFYALCMMPLGVSGIAGILMQGGCTFLLMAVAFWLGQVGAPFRARTLILPLAASLLWGFGLEWAYWPIMLLWLLWQSWEYWKWRSNR